MDNVELKMNNELLLNNGFSEEMVLELVPQFFKLSVSAEQFRKLFYKNVENIKAI